MIFDKELDFEKALVHLLSKYGWTDVIVNPTEEELVANFAKILFENNSECSRLNGVPLSTGEIRQILNQIQSKKTPFALNGFINGYTVSIIRDNPDDKLNFGKTVSLALYHRREIAAGKSRYQIVRQPKFRTADILDHDRRGDVMLLINGMPVIHIELKRSKVSVTQASNQIEKYSYEGVFTGFFSLVQVFVAMTPEETVYFANPGTREKFDHNYFFHWADYNNTPVNAWDKVTEQLLSIPMAHQLIGYYTVADSQNGKLKVMRSYQYNAVSQIFAKTKNKDWNDGDQRGGYIWHTTGSGKTLTSYKAAQLIAESGDADKVIFLVDRIELGTQSITDYRGFSGDDEAIRSTADTNELGRLLKSKNTNDKLIVTSIQKMSRIRKRPDEGGIGFSQRDLDTMSGKRMVFIVDEAHRDTFGEMMHTIKKNFPKAMFFGFTGTPIFTENQKNKNETKDVFGDELHRYSISDGIRDKNVLGFDTQKVLTYKDKDLRREIALEEAKAKNEDEVHADEKKAEIYYRFLRDVKMYTYVDKNGKTVKGIEDYIPSAQYNCDKHRESVVVNILANWNDITRNGKFHGILATSSIPESIEYYRLLKKKAPWLKTTVLVDPNIDNEGRHEFKSEALKEILRDYNARYSKPYKLGEFDDFKKDVSLRLAHKIPYGDIENKPEECLNLLIVVNQMLTGYDSKWVNVLFLDKILQNELIIQAFSRTNRLFGPGKPFGSIIYYRKPHTMERLISDAFALYSGNKEQGIFVSKLGENIDRLNNIYREIELLFRIAKIEGFEKLPAESSERGKFAKLFRNLNSAVVSAQIQGFSWDKKSLAEKVAFSARIYSILQQRYCELNKKTDAGGQGGGAATDGNDIPYDLESSICEIDTGFIDEDYFNSRFTKYVKSLEQPDVSEEERNELLEALHKTFASLSMEDQDYATLVLTDLRGGNLKIEKDKTFKDYIAEYAAKKANDRVHRASEIFGVDETQLRNMLNCGATSSTLNRNGRFDELLDSGDKSAFRKYLEAKGDKKYSPPERARLRSMWLEKFILSNGSDFEL